MIGLASDCQPSTFLMRIWPDASSAQKSIAAVSAEGRMVCVLILRLNSSCRRSMAFVVRALFHWLGGRRVKAKSLIAGLLQAVGDGSVPEPPFAQEGLPALLDVLGGGGVDHVGVVGRDLLVQPLDRVRGARTAPLARRQTGEGASRNSLSFWSIKMQAPQSMALP